MAEGVGGVGILFYSCDFSFVQLWRAKGQEYYPSVAEGCAHFVVSTEARVERPAFPPQENIYLPCETRGRAEKLNVRGL